MPEKTQEQKNKLAEKYLLLNKEPQVAIFEEMNEISEKLNNFSNVEMIKIKGDKGDKGDNGKDGVSPNPREIARIATTMIRIPEDGKTPTREELESLIKPLIPEPLQGEKGERGEKGEKGDLKELSPDEIRNALELLQGEERLDKKTIKGLEEELTNLREEVDRANNRKIIHAPVNQVQYVDLSSQCNGVTKTFNVPLHRKVVLLTGTQFPVIYRPVIDFTTVNHTLTLTDEVGAPETGQTLVFQYIK